MRIFLIGCPLFSDWLLQFLRWSNINLNFIVFHTLKIILQDYVNLETIKKRGSSINPDIHYSKVFSSELKTSEWNILNPDLLFNLKIKKMSRLSLNPDIHHSKVFSSELKTLEWDILNPDRIINLEINDERRTSNI